jgi:hypothetical protein
LAPVFKRVNNSRETSYHHLLENLLHQLVVFRSEGLHVGRVHGRARVAPGTQVLVDAVGLHLKDANAVAVEPVGAALATDVEPGGDVKKWFGQSISGKIQI